MRAIPTKQELDQMVVEPLLAVTLTAIYTAVVAGNTVTASISVGSTKGATIERLFIDLQGNGLVVTNSGSTFTVSW